MALRTLMKRKEIDKLNKELAELRAVDFDAREADIEKMIDEAETDEEREAVNGEIEAFEAEKADNAQKVSELEERVAEIARIIGGISVTEKQTAAAREMLSKNNNK